MDFDEQNGDPQLTQIMILLKEAEDEETKNLILESLTAEQQQILRPERKKSSEPLAEAPYVPSYYDPVGSYVADLSRGPILLTAPHTCICFRGGEI